MNLELIAGNVLSCKTKISQLKIQARRCALESHTHSCPDGAVRSVTPHDPTKARPLLMSLRMPHCRPYPMVIACVFKADQFNLAFNLDPQRPQVSRQQLFSFVLGKEE